MPQAKCFEYDLAAPWPDSIDETLHATTNSAWHLMFSNWPTAWLRICDCRCGIDKPTSEPLTLACNVKSTADVLVVEHFV